MDWLKRRAEGEEVPEEQGKELAELAIVLEEKEAKLSDAVRKYKAAMEETLELGTARKQNKESEPKLKKFLQKLEGLQIKLRGWIVKIHYPRTKTQPKWEGAYKSLVDKIHEVSPVLDSLVAEVTDQAWKLAEEEEIKRVKDVVKVEKDVEKKSSLNVEAESLSWVDDASDMIDEIDSIINETSK